MNVCLSISRPEFDAASTGGRVSIFAAQTNDRYRIDTIFSSPEPVGYEDAVRSILVKKVDSVLLVAGVLVMQGCAHSAKNKMQAPKRLKETPFSCQCSSSSFFNAFAC